MGGEGAQLGIGGGVGQEKCEARRDGVVVEFAGFFLEADKFGGAQHRRVAGDHGIGEGAARFQDARDHREKSRHLAWRDGPALGVFDKGFQ